MHCYSTSVVSLVWLLIGRLNFHPRNALLKHSTSFGLKVHDVHVLALSALIPSTDQGTSQYRISVLHVYFICLAK